MSACLSVTLVYCGQTVGWIKMKLGVQVGLGPGHSVLDENPAPTLPKGHSPQFSAHICCSQIAGWIKMPLGMEVGLGPGDVVFDEDPAPPRKKAQPHPIFGPYPLWPNGWMDQDGTWHGGGPRSAPQCARWRPSYPPYKRGTAPQFSARICCGKWLDGLRCHLVWR